MLTVTCIKKVRDPHDKIVSYKLQDANGEQRIVLPDELKAAIFNGQIVVDNLKLTSDGRLIDSEKHNSTSDIIGREYKEGAKLFIQKLVEKLEIKGIKVTYKSIMSPDQKEKIPCAILKVQNGKIVGTKGNLINVSNEDTWGKTNSSEFAISATLTVKRAQIDGDNMVLDYNVILGYINKNVYGELVFTRADASCMNLETWLNNEMDAYEISTYMSEYDKKKVNNAVDYNKEKMIAEAANCLAVKFIDALSIPTGQLSLSTRIGYGLGNALYNTPVANVIASRATNSAENSGYNTDLSEMYKQSMKQNAEKVNQAAQKLNVKTSQQKAKELSDRMKKKGIFGMFQ